MTMRLALIAYDSNVDVNIAEVFESWFESDLIDQVGLLDIASLDGGLSSSVSWVELGGRSELSLSDVLTRRRWDSVTLVSVREKLFEKYSDERFQREVLTTELVRGRFIDQTVRCYTLGIAQSEPAFGPELFNPYFDAHFLHDPVLVADGQVATLPVDDSNRAAVCFMSAVVLAGGLRWQEQPTVDLSEHATGQTRPVRIIRTQIRAINAGRFIDDVIAGAFPESGPWTTPPEIQAVQAPPGAVVNDRVLDDLCSQTGFGCSPFVGPARKRPEEIGLVAGLLMFGKNFLKALKQAPYIIIDQYVTSVGERVTSAAQRLTFGGNSSKVMAFKPGMSRLEAANLLAELEAARMPDLEPPAIPDPTPWYLLRRTALSLVDGGELPQSIHVPQHNTKRVLYTDPWAIGPAPSDVDFVFSEGEQELLQLPPDLATVGSMDVQNAQAVDQYFDAAFGDSIVEAVDRDFAGTSRVIEVPDVIVEVDGFADVADSVTYSHKPSEPDFDPTSYEPLTSFYQGEKEEESAQYEEQNALHVLAQEQHTVFNGRWRAKKSCDFCGVAFHHGVVYLHTPSGDLVHVGHQCARTHGLQPSNDNSRQIAIGTAQSRWQEWLSMRQKSLLWRVGESIAAGTDRAAEGLADSMSKYLDDSQVDTSQDEDARRALGKWGKVFLLVIVLAVAASVAVWIFALLPLIYIFGGGTAAILAVIVKIGLLARDLARLQTRMHAGASERQVALLAAQHYAKQLSELQSVQTQFDDWQAVLRVLTHTPFGTPPSVSSDMMQSIAVERPHSFVYGASRPSADQLTKAQLNARKMTVHRGWMGTVFEEMRAHWRTEYERVLLDTPPEPEGDNSEPNVVRVRLPGTNKAVFGPRQDFREKCSDGELQKAVITAHTESIMGWLREVPLDDLLAQISVTGSGAALHGLTATDFLDGVQFKLEEAPPFSANLFGNSGSAIRFRSSNVEDVLPPLDEQSAMAAAESAAQGRDLIFANHRITISPAVPPESLAGMALPSAGLVNHVSDDDAGPSVV